MRDDSQRFQFQRLELWQEGRHLYRMVTAIVREFPREEQFGLAHQMRRSARSVCANVAEGAGRNSDRDFAQFGEIAYGSAMEIASDAFLAPDEHYVSQQEVAQLLDQIEKVAAKASGLYRRLTGRSGSGAPRSALSTPPPASA